MTRPSRRDPARLIGWAVFALGLIFTVPPAVKAARGFVPGENKDYALWYEIGRTVLADGPLYTNNELTHEVRYMYPPTLAVFAFAPLSALGYTAFVLGFGAVNAAAWMACVRLAPKLAAAPGESPGWLAVGLPTLLAGVYVWDMFHLGQVNLVLLAAVLAGAAALRNCRPGWAGVCLGLTIAAKVFPLPILCYFVARRSWAAVAATLATLFAVLVVLPAPVRGWDRNLSDLKQWAGIMVGDQSGETMAARSSIGFSRRNQSLVSVVHRLTRPVEAGLDKAGRGFAVNVFEVSPATAQLIGFAGCGVLGAILAVSTRGRFGRTPEAEGLEWGMVCALAVICSPLAWTYFSCWLLPGWAAAVRYALKSKSWRAVGGCGVSGVLLLSAVTEQFDHRLQAVGVTCWGGVALFLTLAGMRWAAGGRDARTPTPPATFVLTGTIQSPAEQDTPADCSTDPLVA